MGFPVQANLERIPDIRLRDHIVEILAVIFLLVNIVIQPAGKYGEYVLGTPRINITILNVFLLTLCLGYYLFNLKEIYHQKISPAFLLLLYLISIQIVSYPEAIGYGNEGLLPYIKTVAKSIVAYSLWYIAGRNLHSVLKFEWLPRVLLISWIFISVFTINNALSNIRNFSLIIDGHLIYLMLADTYAILALFVIHQHKNVFFKNVIYVVSIIVLVALLSRTSLYVFAFTYCLYLYRSHKFQFVIMVSMAVYLLVMFTDDLVGDRMFKILVGGKDKSAQMRRGFLREGFDQIQSNWFLGKFMGDVDIYEGRTGRYIHNILSIWRQFGIVAFGIFIVMSVRAYVKFFFGWLNNKLNDNGILLFYFATYTLAELVVARTFTSAYIWLFIAASERKVWFKDAN